MDAIENGGMTRNTQVSGDASVGSNSPADGIKNEEDLLVCHCEITFTVEIIENALIERMFILMRFLLRVNKQSLKWVQAAEVDEVEKIASQQ